MPELYRTVDPLKDIPHTLWVCWWRRQLAWAAWRDYRFSAARGRPAFERRLLLDGMKTHLAVAHTLEAQLHQYRPGRLP